MNPISKAINELHALSHSGVWRKRKSRTPAIIFSKTAGSPGPQPSLRVADDSAYTKMRNTEQYRVKHAPCNSLDAQDEKCTSEWFTVAAAAGGTSSDQKSLAGNPPCSSDSSPPQDQLGEIHLQLDKTSIRYLWMQLHLRNGRASPGDTFCIGKTAPDDPRQPTSAVGILLQKTGRDKCARASLPLRSPAGGPGIFFSAMVVIAEPKAIRAERLPLDLILIDKQAIRPLTVSMQANSLMGCNGSFEIKRAGYTPALWLALCGKREFECRAQHPEFLLRDTHRNRLRLAALGAKCYSLDLARADVGTWLDKLFRMLSDEWGYELFKLDFHSRRPRRPQRSKTTRARAVPDVVWKSSVRLSATRNILGCGAPFASQV